MMMKILRKALFIGGFTGLIFLGSTCDKMGTGVCTGYSAEFNRTYCKDGWTEGRV